MNRIIYPNDFDKSTLKKYATNIPLLDKFINNYITNNPNNEVVFKINSESRKDNEISFWFQLEHTLVLNGGRDMKGAKPGIVKSIYNDDKYNVRIDNHNSFHKFNIIVEYSKPNIYNVTNSNSINQTSKNKIIYIPPIPFELNVTFCKKNIDILTSYICVGNSKRREIFMNNLKKDNLLNSFAKKNITNVFKLDDLRNIYKDTKVLINVHQTEHHHTFEEFRILPALLSGVLIISEEVPCKDVIPYSDYIIWTSIDNINNTINEVLSNYEIYFNNIFNNESGLKNIIDNMIIDSEKDFNRKILEYIPKKKDPVNNSKLCINQDINIKLKDMEASQSIFDFEKYIKLTKSVEAEFKRLSDFEIKYNDLYDENKNLRKQLKLLKNDKVPQSEHFSLNKCAIDYGLDKVMRFKDGKHIFGHNFISSYIKIFKNFDIDDVDDVLEIGIGCLEKGQMGGKNGLITKFGYKTGNSLRMWRDCFINANIHGIDIYKEAMIINEDRIHTYVCDQSNQSQLKNLMDNQIKKKLDVIVDDGSHELSHQILSFNTLSPYLKKGGIYVIECIQPKNIALLSNLSAFNNKHEIQSKFDVVLYDTRKDTNKNDDFMMVFKLK
jgi:hypothetical protein